MSAATSLISLPRFGGPLLRRLSILHPRLRFNPKSALAQSLQLLSKSCSESANARNGSLTLELTYLLQERTKGQERNDFALSVRASIRSRRRGHFDASSSPAAFPPRASPSFAPTWRTPWCTVKTARSC